MAGELLSQYAELPMDYADATLVVLAEELDTNLVFTTDRRTVRSRSTSPATRSAGGQVVPQFKT